MEFTHLKKAIGGPAGLALLASLGGCGEAEPSAEDLINDASDATANVERAAANMSDALLTAAGTSGEMPCALPALPDASRAQPMNIPGKTYNTASEPEDVAAFYLASAEARDGSATHSGPPGMAEILLELGDAGNCRVVAQALMSGGSNVQINEQ